jgi:hypothetical protein
MLGAVISPVQNIQSSGVKVGGVLDMGTNNIHKK